MALYGKLKYWDERYAYSGDNGAYDWYQTYGTLEHLLDASVFMSGGQEDHFPSRENCRVLILGCGNSTFGDDMRNNGWLGDIVNVDFSSIVIEQMSKKYDVENEKQGREFIPKMQFVCADLTDGLPFGDNSFDLIICKGTFDAILSSNGSVNNVKNMVAESVRVLAPGHGCFFLCTYGKPDDRIVFLEHKNDPTKYWENIGIHTVPCQTQAFLVKHQNTSKNHYVYICRKKHDIDEELPNDAGTASQEKLRMEEENVKFSGEK